MSEQESTHKSRGWPLHTWILIGLLVGGGLGLCAHFLGTSGYWPDEDKTGLADWVERVVYWVESIGQVFLRLMFMVVIPLVFSALVLAVAEIGDLRETGRMGLKTLALTAFLSATSVIIGVTLVNVIRPGDSVSPEQREQLIAKFKVQADQAQENAKKAKPLRETLIDMLPQNPLQEMVGAIDGTSKGNGMLAVMVFALITGVAASANPLACAPLLEVLKGMYAISMTIIGWAMRLAPVGAGCLVFGVTAQLGLSILQTLFWFALTVIVGLTLHLVVTYSFVLVTVARRNPFKFFSDISEAMLVAFGTSSSNASLATAIRVAETKLNIPSRVASFVLTIGATGNQNGTALFEGVVVLFLAQVMGVELSISQQFTVVLMAIFAGIGTAGVPGGSIPLIVAVLESVGVPGASIGIIFGIDRILDMSRTIVNVAGDLVVTAGVARGEEHTPPDEIAAETGDSGRGP